MDVDAPYISKFRLHMREVVRKNKEKKLLAEARAEEKIQLAVERYRLETLIKDANRRKRQHSFTKRVRALLSDPDFVQPSKKSSVEE